MCDCFGSFWQLPLIWKSQIHVEGGWVFISLFYIWTSGQAIGFGPSRTTLSLSVQIASCLYFTVHLIPTMRQPDLSRGSVDNLINLQIPELPFGRSASQPVWPTYVGGLPHLKNALPWFSYFFCNISLFEIQLILKKGFSKSIKVKGK